MSLIVPDEGKLKALPFLTGQFSASLQLRLFQSNTTLTHSTVKADLTEATFSGYTASTSAGSWGTPTLDGSNRATSTFSANNVFTHNGGGTSNTIYGWYILDVGNTKIVYAETFPSGPYLMSHNGDTITVTPKLTLQSEF